MWRMLPVLDLDPTIAPAAAIDALAVLGDEPLQTLKTVLDEEAA